MALPLCFFCGGNARYLCIIHPPRPIAEHEGMICDNCRSIRDDDEIIVFEVVETDPACGNPQFTDGVWFTGRWVNVPRKLALPWFPISSQEKIMEECAAYVRADQFAKVDLTRFQKEVQQ